MNRKVRNLSLPPAKLQPKRARVTDKEALAKLVFELDDLARLDRTWFAYRRLRRLKAAISRLSDLAMRPNLAKVCVNLAATKSLL